MADLFSTSARAAPAASKPTPANQDYSAAQIEVLEGLEPVRRRPGMYVGGTDERALHHLVAELLDNAMDEAVAGHASRIELELAADGIVTVRDNGRGIPVDPHPKFPKLSALEVILTTLHSGGKFSDKAYQTSGGLHGVGLSVVNALSDRLTVEVARERQLWRQAYARGAPVSKLEALGAMPNRRGTTIAFHPDPEIFGAEAQFRPERLYRMARSKAYLQGGVEVRWRCDPALLRADMAVPAEQVLRFPGGLADFLAASMEGREGLTPTPFTGSHALAGGGRLDWAIAWPADEDGFVHSYCNAIPTPDGGTHEAGLRAALTRGLKAHAERAGLKRAAAIQAEDVVGGATILLSLFMREPSFQGQTKERLGSPEATRLVEAGIKDHLDHWLAGNPAAATALVEHLTTRAEERIAKRDQKEVARKTATRRLRLPGKLADCSSSGPDGTELFLVEGDSAGGSAKQARNRETQAILPLRGKILNVASASADKLRGNQELADLSLALGCGTGKQFDLTKLRYQRVIVMTDADVDGAHIAALLLTYFYREMPGIAAAGRLFLAQPPLYRLVQGAKSLYVRDDAEREAVLAKGLGGKGAIEVSRFKGLGEMMAAQLRETTMDPAKRTLIRVALPSAHDAETKDEAGALGDLVERLMGRNPEPRYRFIQENARFVRDLDV